MSYTVQTQYELQQIELEQNYIVMKDLSNVLGILVEYFAVIETGNERLAAIFLNRFITQINLSNAVHYQTHYEAVKTNTQINLNSRKDEALQIFNAILAQLIQDKIVKEENLRQTDLKNLLDTYCTLNLSKYQVVLKQTEINPSQENSQFTEQSLQKIVNAMNQTDTVFGRVQNGKMQQMNPQDQSQLIYREVKQRYSSAQKRLQQVPVDQNISSSQVTGQSKIGSGNIQENKTQEIEVQLLQDTKNIIRVLINTLYEGYPRDDIKEALVKIDSKQYLAIYEYLVPIYNNTQSKQAKSNIFQLGEVLLRKKAFYKENFQKINDKQDLPYLKSLIN